jgi:AAA family ATP:ADP antiporter
MSGLLSRLSDVDRGQLVRLLALMGLFFLVICAIGILRPIKNAVALGGLGETEFYQVYVISAVVVGFVPLYNWLGEHVRWRRMISATALAFAAVLLIFRGTYREGSAVYGLLFYGWYDLLAAVMVTQFFMATQLQFDARTAKRFYPLVIAGGSLGATLGGLVTGLSADLLGVPNLILVAAVLIGTFAVAVPFVTEGEATLESPDVHPVPEETDASGGPSLKRVFGNAEVRLITASVLLTILVKQLVDYQFNTISAEVFVTTTAISEFQGWFNAGTQWLPLVVLVGLRPLLQRWGVGIALFMLPVFMLGANLGLALSWSLVAAVTAKAGDTGIRYAAERTAREILYVPVPEDLKMRAKGYIDVAVEKGVGKVLSAVMIFALLGFMDYRELGWVAAGLALVSLVVARAIHGEYLEALAASFRDRRVSLKGLFASLGDASALPVVREALGQDDPAQLAFALDVLEEADPDDVRDLADEIAPLLDHPSAEIRARALDLVPAAPAAFASAPVEPRLEDPEARVREAAVRAWVAQRDGSGDAVRELLHRDEPEVRRALLRCVGRGELPAAGSGLVDGSYLTRRWGGDADEDAERDARLDVALASAAVEEPRAARPYLERLLRDTDPEVASAALLSAARLELPGSEEVTVEALGSPATRQAAGDALVARGERVVELLGRHLADDAGRREVRLHLPRVLARIRCQASVDVLLASYAAPETDQLLDFRTLKALNKLRASGEDLRFDEAAVRSALGRELAAARRYGRAEDTLAPVADGPASRLLHRAVQEARDRRREAAFRCLGLLLPPDRVYRCYLAVTRGERRVRASAVEWLERMVDRELFERLRPLLGEGTERSTGSDAEASLEHVLRELGRDKDRWLTRCAIWAGAEMGVSGLARLTEGNRGDPADDELRALARKLEEAAVDAPTVHHDPKERSMNLVQKVFLLQHVDLLHGARSEHLALVASVAGLVEADAGARLLRRGEPPDAMFVVVDGTVELRRDGDALKVATDGMAFGTWALVDEEPSLVDARATDATTLLRISRRDFHDVLADNPELALGLLQGLSQRVRELIRI